MATPRTLFEKVWDDHVIQVLGDNVYLLQIDRLFLHELSGDVALRALTANGRKAMSPRQIFATIDHVVDTTPGRGDATRIPGGTERIRSLRKNAAAHGIHLCDVGAADQGIVHVVSPERGIALPGLTLVCGDSHTCTVGGIGALAFGIGSTECEHVAATQCLAQEKPKTFRVNFEGRLPEGVFAKDMILRLIGEVGAQAGIGHAVEFAGAAIRALPVEGRLTVCNMAIEFSAKYGMIAPDETTIEYLAGRAYAPKGEVWEKAVAHWRSLPSDPDARFDREVTIDCGSLAPQVTWGTSPMHVVGVNEAIPDPARITDAVAAKSMVRALEYMALEPGKRLSDYPIDAAFIGSCTNSRISDLRAAAKVLDGRKVKAGLTAICVPGSTEVKKQAEAEGLDRIFKAAGFEWRESGCSLCFYGGGETFGGKRVMTTTNRNFEGRQGPNARSHLASPASVAASAVMGRIADVRQLGA